MAKSVMLDIDGVLTVSWQPLPGAVETTRWLQEQGFDFRLVTNSSSRSRSAIAKLLSGSGMQVDESKILTAVTSAVRYLKEGHLSGSNCLVLNEGDLTEDLEGLSLTDASSADVVLLGGAGPSLGYADFDAVFKLALRSIPVVALHHNLRFRNAGGLALDMGAFIAGLEAAAGIEIPIVGKPAPAFFHAAFRDLGVEPVEAIVVGDDLASDVLGAQAVGATGILVKTGKFHPSDLEANTQRPDHIIDGIGELPALIEQMAWS
jgi:HAD superfamily hydrolase (TIGR01458 family)